MGRLGQMLCTFPERKQNHRFHLCNKIKLFTYLYIHFLSLLKTRQQAQNEVPYAKPPVTKARLHFITVWVSRKWNLNPVDLESPDQH